MKAIIKTAGLFAAVTSACMSDKACSSGEVSMCCYMNECVPSSTLGCQGSRLDFYKHLATKDFDCKMKGFASELLKTSEKVKKCDDMGLHCIDYVTALMSDSGAFDQLEGVGELSQV